MAPRSDPGPAGRLYLEDLQVGQRIVSRSHTIKSRSKAFAAQFDPQVFHLDQETARTTFFGGLVASGWHTAAVTMLLLVDGGAPIAGGVIVREAKSVGQGRHDRAMCCRWKARYSK